MNTRSLRYLAALAAISAAGSAQGQLFDWLKKDKDKSRGDAWAIRCISIDGPDAARLAHGYGDALKGIAGFKADLVRVIDGPSGSTLYYGEYRRRYDARNEVEMFDPDPRPTLERLRGLSLGGQDIWPFQLATMAALPGASEGGQDWALRDAKGYWSLQVAVFYDTGEFRQRREAAEQYCKLLRDQGEEAYVDHGDVHSIVSIGTFPKSAIQAFRRPHPLTGDFELRERMVDERLLALQKKFPHNLHNGAVFYEVRRDPARGAAEREAHTSFAVRIPSREVNPFTGE